MISAVTRPSITAAGLILDERGHVLVVTHTYKAPLGLPGGTAHLGELPRAACARELAEELGIRPRIGHLLVIDWAPHPIEGDRLVFVFNAGTLTSHQQAEIRTNPAEISTHTFRAPEHLGQSLTPGYARRVHAAMAARRTGRIAYLEHGRAV